VFGGGEHAYVLAVDAGPARNCVLIAERNELLQVALVVDIGVRREPAFDREMRQETRRPRER
jgi:hypothetical protein